MAIDPASIREHLQHFDFRSLFIEDLGWLRSDTKSEEAFDCRDQRFTRKMIAHLGGVAVFEITSGEGKIPDADLCMAVHRAISPIHFEHLLIFVDKDRTQSLWYWVKREGNKPYPRRHYYFKGQPGDLFLSKISAMFVDISELSEGDDVTVAEAAARLRKALDVEQVSRKFYEEYRDKRLAFIDKIQGIDDDKKRRWYASVLLNRLMFIYFLQRKGFVNNHDYDYLQDRLKESRERGKDRYFSEFLDALFFEGFAKPEGKRSPEAEQLIGKVHYLNGGLFLPHEVEEEYKGRILIADEAFDEILALFGSYSWNLDDTPGGDDRLISPHVLGYIFERYINDKSYGAYYTRPEITTYLCEQTIHRLILDKVNAITDIEVLPSRPRRRFEEIGELYHGLDADICAHLVDEVLPGISILDPACGSGAFLVAAMRTMLDIYGVIIGRLHVFNDGRLNAWFRKLNLDHRSVNYHLKKKIITENIYGVDIMPEAAEIARLRLFLELVASAETEDELEPLPNIDFNILHGNSLIGLLSLQNLRSEKQVGMEAEHLDSEVAERNRMIETYRNLHQYREDLVGLRDKIEIMRQEHYQELNSALLLGQFKGVKYEEATWDSAKQTEGKPKKRPLTMQDITALEPFHWGYDFDPIMNKRGGFDVIITNPPWDVFQTNEKEFFQQFFPSIQKNKLRIEDWEHDKQELMNEPAVRADWLRYSSQFPHQWVYFKEAAQYSNQTTTIDGKAVGNKANLCNLFVEQCFNLLHRGGHCGIVVPSGIYTDLGTKQLREMLFSNSQITGLFGFENRQSGGGVIFDNVDSRFKFVVLTYAKDGKTEHFPAAFMRHDVRELERFPDYGALQIPTELVRILSPDSLSIPELGGQIDLTVITKVVLDMRMPLLGDCERGWCLELYGEELNMTRSVEHFLPTATASPVYEGAMIWHFDHNYSAPRRWVSYESLRPPFLGKRVKRIGGMTTRPQDMKLDCEAYRLAIRKIAANTNERTLVSTVVPKLAFAGNSLSVHFPYIHQPEQYNELRYKGAEILVLSALLNAFVSDYILRSRMTTNLNLFYIYQLPVPRLTPRDTQFKPIVERAAKLICTTPEFDDLAREVGLRGHEDGVTDPAERAKLRAELDGMIAHLYGLTEDEFAHILSTFPLVDQSIKDAAMEEFKRQAPKAGDTEIAGLIAKGESAKLEFKSSARWDMVQNIQNKAMEKVIVKTVAGFLNSQDGGTLLIGVEDSGNVIGLAHDYQTLGKKPNQDGYDLWLHDLLLNACGKDAVLSIKVSFHEHHGLDVCRVDLSAGPKETWVRDEGFDHLYVRTGNSTKEYSGRDAVDYIRNRWK